MYLEKPAGIWEDVFRSSYGLFIICRERDSHVNGEHNFKKPIKNTAPPEQF